MIASLESCLDEAQHGGKAAQLSAGVRSGLPIPQGVAIDSIGLDRFVVGNVDAVAAICDAMDLSAGVAVRSSAIGEDSFRASFAGIHATVLNVRTERGLAEALRTVHASARSEAACAYRRRNGLPATQKMAAVVQVLVNARVAGVLFTRDPVTGEDVRLVEATWGLGTSVADGTVTPDSYRIARGGRIVDRRAGRKQVAIVSRREGEGIVARALDRRMATELCLRDAELSSLERLAQRCEAVFQGPHDVEFAFESAAVWLLQRRAITGHFQGASASCPEP
jgi:pyruvate,water dikinase